MGVWRDPWDAAINRRTGRGTSTVAGSDQRKTLAAGAAKKFALHLDDRPANGCHRNSVILVVRHMPSEKNPAEAGF